MKYDAKKGLFCKETLFSYTSINDSSAAPAAAAVAAAGCLSFFLIPDYAADGKADAAQYDHSNRTRSHRFLLLPHICGVVLIHSCCLSPICSVFLIRPNHPVQKSRNHEYRCNRSDSEGSRRNENSDLIDTKRYKICQSCLISDRIKFIQCTFEVNDVL